MTSNQCLTGHEQTEGNLLTSMNLPLLPDLDQAEGDHVTMSKSKNASCCPFGLASVVQLLFCHVGSCCRSFPFHHGDNL